MIVFRQADPRYPFLWSDATQPAARWHGDGEGPAHYFADTPDGAWAELLRHEEITDAADAATLRRALWAVEIGNAPSRPVSLDRRTATGGLDTYASCQSHARALRAGGTRRLTAPSAALVAGGAAGREVVDGRERTARRRNGRVVVVFGRPDDLVGWKIVDSGAPPSHVLPRVRPFPAPRDG
jgi:hypothetical protein